MCSRLVGIIHEPNHEPNPPPQRITFISPPCHLPCIACAGCLWPTNSTGARRLKRRSQMKAYEKFAAGLILGTSLAAQALAESKYSPWGPPVNLGCVVNSTSPTSGPGSAKLV